MHDHNCFVTLTYNDANLPESGSLYKPHLQKFFKRLRKHFGSDTDIRYYACGEYGDNTQRAHYHACIFGIDFHDKIPFKRTGEHTLYISKTLNEIWGHGNTSIGDLTFETAAYTARYVMKKTTGKACKRYVQLDHETGELIPLVQPFAAMSLRPAIGRRWLEKYHGDIYNANKDFVVLRGKKLKPPKYYDTIYDNIDNDRLEEIKSQRIRNAEPLSNAELRARAKITHARMTAKTQL